MADIKTHLRELSLILGLREYDENIIKSITPKEYLKIIQNNLTNYSPKVDNFSHLQSFSPELRVIIHNGFRLGVKIIEQKLVNPRGQIIWTGCDTQKNDPVDLYVGEVGFSLKEDSYILENMGLYKYLNLLTNSKFKRGLHVFEEFAPNEYNNWFAYTWNLLVERISKNDWVYNNKGKYISEIRLRNKMVLFVMDNKVISELPVNISSIGQFSKLTNSTSREKVFSKWINDEISNKPNYVDIKNICSVTAGENLVNFINNNLKPQNISRFFQVFDKSYYYAKTTTNGIAIFYVPGQQDFFREISVHPVEYSVPSSQLNIHTIIENTKNKKIIVFRNECRFSHGQFNGTPEAKMYYERGNDLSVIYDRVF